MRKITIIAFLLIILNPIIIYSQSLDSNGKVNAGNLTLVQAEGSGVPTDPIVPNNIINKADNQNVSQANQQLIPKQAEQLKPSASAASAATKSSRNQEAVAPQSAPKTQNILPPIRPRNINEPIAQQLKESAANVQSQPGQVIAPPTAPHTVQSPAGIPMSLTPQKSAPGQPNMPNQSPGPGGEFIPPNPPQLPSAAQNRAMIVSPGNVSLNFDDADVYSVIQTVFGEILKVNYIIDSRVKGRVTFRSVAPVSREKVLPLMEVILRLNGVAVIEDSGLYRIIPISDLSREPSEIKIGRKIIDADLKGKAVLQIVPLNYVQSSEIVKLINPFVSTNAVIVDVPKANHIIIADTDANVRRILHLIEYFDSEVKEKKGVRVFVHHVQNAKSKDIVAMLQQVFLGAKTQTTDRISKPSTGQTSAPAATQTQPVVVSAQAGGHDAIVSDIVKIFADEKLNAVVILGTREDYNIIKETIKELDLVPRQVLIEGTIASILLTDKMSLGLAWSIKTNLSGLGLDPVNISFNPAKLTTNPADGLNVIGIDSSAQVRAVINALATQSKAKLLASPHITVSDNNEARIQVGQQVPIPTSETYSSTGLTPIRTIQYKDIGIILKVKPMINDSGLINLQISQEVSTYSKDTLYSNEQQIILQKTEATTTLVVKDGHTIVIGGLIREDDSNAKTGIPWLIKIPIFGYLFGNTSKDKTRTELVILLTPYIIRDQEDVVSISNALNKKVTDKEIIEELKKNIHNGKRETKETQQKK